MFTEITDMGTSNTFAKTRELNENECRYMIYKTVLSALICHFCENSMLAHAALVLKDNRTTIGIFGKLRGNSRKMSCSCCYMLSFSFLFVVSIFC